MINFHRAALLLLLPTLVLSTPAANLQILNTTVSYCDIPITTSRSPNGFTITFDTSQSTGSMPDSLASTDRDSTTENTCLVCTRLKWEGRVYGSILSIGYDYWHKLEAGSLEQIVSYVTMDGGARDEYFESLYTYGSEETATTYHMQSTVLNGSDALVLDYTREYEEVCVQTAFRVISRGGWDGGALAEISRRSVFVESVNLGWSEGKP